MTIRLSGNTFSKSEPHSHIISLAEGDFDSLKSRFADGGFNYDHAFEVFDPLGLACALINEGILSSGRPFKDVVTMDDPPQRVKYGKRSRDITEDKLLVTGPFAKDIRFQEQNEYRIHYVAKDQYLADRLIVSIDEPERFMRQLKSRAKGQSMSKSPTLDRDALADEIKVLANKIGQVECSARLGSLDSESVRLCWAARLNYGVRIKSNVPYRPSQSAMSMQLDALELALREAGIPDDLTVSVREFRPI